MRAVSAPVVDAVAPVPLVPRVVAVATAVLRGDARGDEPLLLSRRLAEASDASDDKYSL